MTGRHHNLAQLTALPLDAKVQMSRQRILAYAEHFDHETYVAFSGGKDSTVLLHLVRQTLGDDTPAVFCNTGLEYPEVLKFVRQTPGVTWIRPRMTFKQVIYNYGWPVISKAVSKYVREVRLARSDTPTKRLRLTGVGLDGEFKRYRKIPDKYMRLLDAPFGISDRCCDVFKKRPFAWYERQSGLKPYIGLLAAEGELRRHSWHEYGCNRVDGDHPRSIPLAFWTDKDIWDYIHQHGLAYCSIYELGYKRTGCMWCAFGAHLEAPPNRFQLLAQTHPKLYAYAMDELGLRPVLAYLGICAEPIHDFKPAACRGQINR